MSGTSIGGHRAAEKNRLLHGKDFYARIGAIGGRKGTTGGFAANRDLARRAGRIGGLKSRRGKVTLQAPVQVAEKVEVKKSDLDLAA